MKSILTEEQISLLCMYMRIIDLMKGNPDISEANPEMKAYLKNIYKAVEDIFAMLTDEQKDELLETHKLQLNVLKQNSSE
ncbi:MAG: hypothetical protein Q8928_04780 [Bacteroidota bacterium]|nr:hypothetical protein [Bacteroidota bacterium]